MKKLIVIAVVAILFASFSKETSLPIPPNINDLGKISWIDSSTVSNGQFEIKPVGVTVPLASFTSALNTTGFVTGHKNGNYEVIVSPNAAYTSFGVFIYENNVQIYGSYKPSGQNIFSVDSTKQYKVVFK